ncbi:MAG: tRNA (N6-threonylcarbamoyladenosine(37)-N6)-methyltransferase TrmO [Paludibacteraceae bacterium]|nr:tRNA (N6-threonylcarbamoyladenosine(37)-N6)-methyltransferase TrmO [Paludibacteraceae bacterium]
MLQLQVIAHAHNGHTDKFGIPRQSRTDSPIITRIVFTPPFRVREALRGIEDYSHLWLVWGFSQVSQLNPSSDVQAEGWSPTVRPPRLGGNTRVGVFATRSPFRPNPLGLTSVQLVGIEEHPQEGMVLLVKGADLLDGTPIYDIKPYLSFSDSHPDAQNGFAEQTKDYRLQVEWLTECLLPLSVKDDIEYILSQDPRPAYQHDSQREYKLDYAGYTITFCVNEERESQIAQIKKIEKL